MGQEIPGSVHTQPRNMENTFSTFAEACYEMQVTLTKLFCELGLTDDDVASMTEEDVLNACSGAEEIAWRCIPVGVRAGILKDAIELELSSREDAAYERYIANYYAG